LQNPNPVTPYGFDKHSDDLYSKEIESRGDSRNSPVTINKKLIKEEYRTIARVFDRFFLALAIVVTITVAAVFLSNF
jgi:hypothetical protein